MSSLAGSSTGLGFGLVDDFVLLGAGFGSGAGELGAGDEVAGEDGFMGSNTSAFMNVCFWNATENNKILIANIRLCASLQGHCSWSHGLS